MRKTEVALIINPINPVELNNISLNSKDKKRTQIPEEYPYKIVDIRAGTSDISKVKNGKDGIKGILMKKATRTDNITKIIFCERTIIF